MSREGPCPVVRKEYRMTRDEALMQVRERAGGDLSGVPGPVILRAVKLLVQCNGEKEDA